MVESWEVQWKWSTIHITGFPGEVFESAAADKWPEAGSDSADDSADNLKLVGRPGKTESRGMTYLDVWRSGTFLLHSCKAAFWIQETSVRLMLSAQSFYGLCLRSVAHSLTCCFSGNVQLLHTSRYVIPRDSVLPGLLPALVLHVINAGVRRPGYKALLAVVTAIMSHWAGI